jgi:hypothetical protein
MNPYQSPHSARIDKRQIDPLWLRLYFAFFPKRKCQERGHAQKLSRSWWQVLDIETGNVNYNNVFGENIDI